MYAKVFQSIYDGTLVEDWRALVTFQQMLILASADGVVDMTAASISRRTGIPLEIVTAGIAKLEEGDPHSRTPDFDGRRISRLDQHRDWGWFIVNHKKYRAKITKDEKNAADRERIFQRRQEENLRKSDISQHMASCSIPSQGVAKRSEVSPHVADVAHTDTDTDKEREKPSGDKSPSGSSSATPTTPEAKSNRLRQVTLDAIEAYNAKLTSPNGLLSRVGTKVGLETRMAQVRAAIKTASQICQQLYGTPTVTREFWEAYCDEVANDPFKSGKQPGGQGHENWKPGFKYLLRPAVMAEVFDAAMMRSEAA